MYWEGYVCVLGRKCALGRQNWVTSVGMWVCFLLLDFNLILLKELFEIKQRLFKPSITQFLFKV